MHEIPKVYSRERDNLPQGKGQIIFLVPAMWDIWLFKEWLFLDVQEASFIFHRRILELQGVCEDIDTLISTYTVPWNKF